MIPYWLSSSLNIHDDIEAVYRKHTTEIRLGNYTSGAVFMLALRQSRLPTPRVPTANLKMQCLCGFLKRLFHCPNRLYGPIPTTDHVAAGFGAKPGAAARHGGGPVGHSWFAQSGSWISLRSASNGVGKRLSLGTMSALSKYRLPSVKSEIESPG